MINFLFWKFTPVGFILFILFFFVIVFILFSFYVQARNRRAVKGHHICMFLKKSGQMEMKLLPIVEGKIEAPPEHKVAGGNYFTNPNKQFDILYPPGALIKMWQVNAKFTLWGEGNPEPIDPFGQPALVNAILIKTSIAQKFGQLMLETANDLYDKLDKIMKAFDLKPMYVYIGLLLAIAVGAFAAYQGVSANAKCDAIIRGLQVLTGTK